MSDMGDMYRLKRDQLQKENAKRLKWNTDVVMSLAADLEFVVKQHNDVHFSLIHPTDGRMDYWPSTGRACWVKGKRAAKSFRIPDIESYILKHFKTK